MYPFFGSTGSLMFQSAKTRHDYGIIHTIAHFSGNNQVIFSTSMLFGSNLPQVENAWQMVVCKIVRAKKGTTLTALQRLLLNPVHPDIAG